MELVLIDRKVFFHIVLVFLYFLYLKYSVLIFVMYGDRIGASI